MISEDLLTMYIQSSKYLLVLASARVLASESHDTHDHIYVLLSDGSGGIQTLSSLQYLYYVNVFYSRLFC
jgi:hypothetical protein